MNEWTNDDIDATMDHAMTPGQCTCERQDEDGRVVLLFDGSCSIHRQRLNRTPDNRKNTKVTIKPDLLPASQVADLFQVKPHTIRVWIRQGKFPGAEYINHRWYLPREEVIDLARQKLGE